MYNMSTAHVLDNLGTSRSWSASRNELFGTYSLCFCREETCPSLCPTGLSNGHLLPPAPRFAAYSRHLILVLEHSFSEVFTSDFSSLKSSNHLLLSVVRPARFLYGDFMSPDRIFSSTTYGNIPDPAHSWHRPISELFCNLHNEGTARTVS